MRPENDTENDTVFETLVERATGRRVRAVHALGGGSVAVVARVTLDDGTRLVAKRANSQTGPKTGHKTGLAREGFMLEYLARNTNLPVPAVEHASDDLLLMEWLASSGRLDATAERHAADLVAALHEVTAPKFGFDGATVIGGLDQPNPWTDSWRDFFRDRRLLYMGREAMDAGRLSAGVMARLETLADRLDTWIAEPARASLVHGDMWGGNVLTAGGKITGFIDPAIYYADAEIELAFTTLFNTFGDAFFARYAEHRPIRAGFFEERRDLYNLYPLLVHVRLFGGHYVNSVERTLERFGC